MTTEKTATKTTTRIAVTAPGQAAPVLDVDVATTAPGGYGRPRDLAMGSPLDGALQVSWTETDDGATSYENVVFAPGSWGRVDVSAIPDTPRKTDALTLISGQLAA